MKAALKWASRLAASCMFVSMEALAQVPISDVELLAAYCVGVLQQRDTDRRHALAQPCTLPNCDEIRSVLLREQAEDAQRLSRYQKYLAAKTFTGQSEGRSRRLMAMSASQKNGSIDQQQCLSGRFDTFNTAFQNCGPVCIVKGQWVESPRCTQCSDQYESQSCKLAFRCDDLSWLPF